MRIGRSGCGGEIILDDDGCGECGGESEIGLERLERRFVPIRSCQSFDRKRSVHFDNSLIGISKIE